ncbi:fumarylacetoacetate hydrolase [Rhizobiales bacterium GAS191]|nr:fumarylacetoacetate hydrolase [Rhizobiales bacterium GAS191]
MLETDATHDPARRSFVETANLARADFPLQNLPFGIFRRQGDKAGRGGVAIGDQIFDLAAAREVSLFSGLAETAAVAACEPKLNALMALGNQPAQALRARLANLLDAEGPERRKLEAMADRLLVPMAEAVMELPTTIGNFTDFLTSSFHSERLAPSGKVAANFKSMPIAYHSRASSVRVSGGTVLRPHGQWLDEAGAPHFGPSLALDYELELGAYIGAGNALGSPIALDDARAHIFGYCLLNDWSVRDVQRWESNPLGPFLAKSLSTSVSPWVITEAAMRPFRTAAFARPQGDPAPLPYLASERERESGGFDLKLRASLLTPRLREGKQAPERVTSTNFKHMYWTLAQMLTHHASNGCNLMPGDLIGSGTTSGPTDQSRACLAEITTRGTKPLALPNGETRAWLEDGDEVIFRARAERQGFTSIGFGECRGTIGPAVAWPVAAQGEWRVASSE